MSILIAIFMQFLTAINTILLQNVSLHEFHVTSSVGGCIKLNHMLCMYLCIYEFILLLDTGQFSQQSGWLYAVRRVKHPV